MMNEPIGHFMTLADRVIATGIRWAIEHDAAVNVRDLQMAEGILRAAIETTPIPQEEQDVLEQRLLETLRSKCHPEDRNVAVALVPASALASVGYQELEGERVNVLTTRMGPPESRGCALLILPTEDDVVRAGQGVQEFLRRGLDADA